MQARYFKQFKNDSVVNHWRWTKNNGVMMAIGNFPTKYETSDYTLKELLSKFNGESISEVEFMPLY